ncbi:MAG: hypothetical protein J3K34DRAFT_525408 [Monoraphidium minutum]|nr:MAG: hypothetical protein J3K34DRAFT_525408 [Monoraphidium minutum]
MDIHTKDQLQPAGGAKGSCGASDCSDTTRDTAKDQDARVAGGAASGRSSPASPRVCVDDLTPHLRCGLCREPVAGSLVLSCGHLFCGQCLCDHLTSTPACPACQMSLRAIPVRCHAIDHVVGALLPALAPAVQDAFRHRKERGECAPSIIAKMLWWLEAGAPAPGGGPDPAPAALGGLLQQHQQHAAAATHGVQHMLGRAGSGGGGLGHHQAASARIAAASSAAHDAAVAAAMSAAAAAAAAASAPPPSAYGMPPQLGGMGLGGLGGYGGAMGLGGGLGAMGPGALAALGGAAGLLGHGGLHDPSAAALPDMSAYSAALSAMAMQSAAAGLPGQGAYGGGGGAYGGFGLLGM